MKKNIIIFCIGLLLFSIPSVFAELATYPHVAFKVADGKDIDLGGTTMRNGSFSGIVTTGTTNASNLTGNFNKDLTFYSVDGACAFGFRCVTFRDTVTALPFLLYADDTDSRPMVFIRDAVGETQGLSPVQTNRTVLSSPSVEVVRNSNGSITLRDNFIYSPATVPGDATISNKACQGNLLVCWQSNFSAGTNLSNTKNLDFGGKTQNDQFFLSIQTNVTTSISPKLGSYERGTLYLQTSCSDTTPNASVTYDCVGFDSRATLHGRQPAQTWPGGTRVWGGYAEANYVDSSDGLMFGFESMVRSPVNQPELNTTNAKYGYHAVISDHNGTAAFYGSGDAATPTSRWDSLIAAATNDIGRYIIRIQDSNDGLTPHSDAPGTMYLNGSIKQGAWIACSFENSWTNVGSSQETCAYMKDSMGFVHLKGGLASGTINTVMFTLPPGYHHGAAASKYAAVSNNLFSVILIDTNGGVTPLIGNNAEVDINGITFKTD